MKRQKFLVLALIALSCFLGAARAADSFESIFSLPPEEFRPGRDQPTLRVYLKPGSDLRAYNSLIIESLGFMERDASGAWNLLVSDEKDKIDVYFRQAMVDALREKNIAVVTQPGPGVARLRVAVTGLEQVKPGFKVRDLIPVRMVINVARLAAGAELYLLDISTVSEMSDSQSGALLAGSINKLAGSSTKRSDESITLDFVKKLVDTEAKLGAVSLARAMAPHP